MERMTMDGRKAGCVAATVTAAAAALLGGGYAVGHRVSAPEPLADTQVAPEPAALPDTATDAAKLAARLGIPVVHTPDDERDYVSPCHSVVALPDGRSYLLRGGFRGDAPLRRDADAERGSTTKDACTPMIMSGEASPIAVDADGALRWLPLVCPDDHGFSECTRPLPDGWRRLVPGGAR